jgi:hypothetical protein
MSIRYSRIVQAGLTAATLAGCAVGGYHKESATQAEADRDSAECRYEGISRQSILVGPSTIEAACLEARGYRRR